MRIKIDGALIREDVHCSIESHNEAVDIEFRENIYAFKAPKFAQVILTLTLSRENLSYSSDGAINLMHVLDFKDVKFELERWQKAFCKVMNYKNVKTCYDPRLSTPNALFFKKGFEYKK